MDIIPLKGEQSSITSRRTMAAKSNRGAFAGNDARSAMSIIFNRLIAVE
jgi:hypothetical protein